MVSTDLTNRSITKDRLELPLVPLSAFRYMVMPGNVIHIPALGKQIVNFAKNGITNNLRDPLLNQRLGTRSAILLSLHASKRLSFVKSRVAK